MSKKEKLIQLIHEENQAKATLFALEMLDNKEVDVIDLFQNILTEALYRIECAELDKECIWREHIKTSIVRTIIEVSYPYVLKKIESIEKNGKKVLIVCPVEEYHEIGARMAHTFFTLHGFDSVFIGANTPLNVVLDSVKYMQPDFVAISVTNFYNIIKAKEIVSAIKLHNPNTKIIAGGQAFENDAALETVQADYHISSFDSIKDIK